MARRSRSHTEKVKAMDRHVHNVFACIGLIKAHAHEAAEIERFERLSDETVARSLAVDRLRVLADPLQRVVMLVLLFVSGLVVGALIHEGLIAVPSLLVFCYLLRENVTRVSLVGVNSSKIAAVQGNIEELESVFGADSRFEVGHGALAFTGLKDGIELRELQFSYPDGTRALRGVSFTLSKGCTTALIGATGSGKSTLARLLARQYACAPGSILIDGRDIADFERLSLAAGMALVSQDVQLFNASLRFNLAYPCKDVSEEQLWKALEKAQLATFVRGLAEGLDTEIGDRGVRLSGGERQRLSLARAIVKDTGVLILDEATSFLDVETESLIQEAVDSLLEGRTSLVIAHRLSTIKKAHHVVVLDQGCVLEQGSIDELLAQRGAFFRYWSQSGMTGSQPAAELQASMS